MRKREGCVRKGEAGCTSHGLPRAARPSPPRCAPAPPRHALAPTRQRLLTPPRDAAPPGLLTPPRASATLRARHVAVGLPWSDHAVTWRGVGLPSRGEEEREWRRCMAERGSGERKRGRRRESEWWRWSGERLREGVREDLGLGLCIYVRSG